jgi:hypothetical protein
MPQPAHICGVEGEAYRLEADLKNKKAKAHARKGCGGVQPVEHSLL